MMRKTNARKCILTNQSKPKSELIRIVRHKAGAYLVDSNAKGRGAYISKDVTAIDMIVKKRLLNRSFRAPVPMEVYKKLIELLKRGN